MKFSSFYEFKKEQLPWQLYEEIRYLTKELFKLITLRKGFSSKVITGQITQNIDLDVNRETFELKRLFLSHTYLVIFFSFCDRYSKFTNSTISKLQHDKAGQKKYDFFAYFWLFPKQVNKIIYVHAIYSGQAQASTY